MNKFWILWHFNVVVQPKYYMSQRFNFAIWPKYHNSGHFNCAVVLKIKFLICMSLRYFRNFRKKQESLKCLKASLNTFFDTHWIHKSIKSIRKTSFRFHSVVIFIVCLYKWTNKYHDGGGFLLWKWFYIAICKIFSF